jgi:hypothetical protein
VHAWPLASEELIEEQSLLATLEPTAWQFEVEGRIGVFVCFARRKSGPGQAGDLAWAAACVGRDTAVVPGLAGAPCEPGLLALREGELLEGSRLRVA